MHYRSCNVGVEHSSRLSTQHTPQPHLQQSRAASTSASPSPFSNMASASTHHHLSSSDSMSSSSPLGAYTLGTSSMPDSDMVTYATLTPANGQSPYVNGVSNTNEQNHNATNMIPNNNCSTQGKANGKRSGGASAQTAQKSYQTVNGKSNGQNSNNMTKPSPGGGKKTKGRVKIKMEFIDNKL